MFLNSCGTPVENRCSREFWGFYLSKNKQLLILYMEATLKGHIALLWKSRHTLASLFNKSTVLRSSHLDYPDGLHFWDLHHHHKERVQWSYKKKEKQTWIQKTEWMEHQLTSTKKNEQLLSPARTEELQKDRSTYLCFLTHVSSVLNSFNHRVLASS